MGRLKGSHQKTLVVHVCGVPDLRLLARSVPALVDHGSVPSAETPVECSDLRVLALAIAAGSPDAMERRYRRTNRVEELSRFHQLSAGSLRQGRTHRGGHHLQYPVPSSVAVRQGIPVLPPEGTGSAMR